MSGGKWLRLQADYMHDELTIELGAEHGPAGPLVFVALLCSAKRNEKDGYVKLGWRQLARKAFLDGDAEARGVIATCVELGMLEELDETQRGFTARIAGWEKFQRPADPKAAKRMKDLRERRKAEEQDQLHAKRYGVTPVTEPEHPQSSPAVTSVTATTLTETTDEDVDKNRTRSSTAAVAHEFTLSEAEAGALSYFGVSIENLGGLHPLFPQVSAIALQTMVHPKCRDLQLNDSSIESTLRAAPSGVDIIAAAHGASADLTSGRRSTRFFHVVLADKLQDAAKAGVSHVPGRGTRPHQSELDADRWEQLADRYDAQEEAAA